MVARFERFSYAISEISRHWHKISSDEMERYGLKGPHSVYLIAMSRFPDGATAKELCEYCGKDKSDVSRMISILEKKGLVVKQGVHQNNYKGVWKLTDEGRRAAFEVGERARLAVDIAGAELSDSDREIFYRAMETIALKLREISENGLPLQDLK